jgi:nicotinate-nucleotide adenylyltransferase
VGADAAADLPRWAEVEALAQMVELIGFPRPGAAVPAGPIRRTIDVPAVAISASAIRQRVAQGQSIRYLVPDAVREYIATRRLYR